MAGDVESLEVDTSRPLVSINGATIQGSRDVTILKQLVRCPDYRISEQSMGAMVAALEQIAFGQYKNWPDRTPPKGKNAESFIYSTRARLRAMDQLRYLGRHQIELAKLVSKTLPEPSGPAEVEQHEIIDALSDDERVTIAKANEIRRRAILQLRGA